MKSWTKPTDDLVQRALESVKTDVERSYFFLRLKNPHWIEPLRKRDFFKHPPEVKQLPDGYVQYPFWPEFQFLKNVANEAPEQVIEVIFEISETDNPRFYNDVIDIALDVEASLSTRLKTRIIEYAQGKYPFLNACFGEVLRYWVNSGQIESALELTDVLITFQPDPNKIEKQKRRRAKPKDWTTSLDPRPRFDDWKYQEILDKGVRPLSEREPYQTAKILIDATATMIRLGFHQDKLDKGSDNDGSAIWCERVNEPRRDYQDSKVNLVNALTFACEKVYEQASESVATLDQELRKQRWNIFMRIRQHLYALHPNEQTKLWIREIILGHEDYGKWEHHFEFQRMIRLACENLGADLLTKAEKERIFEAILNGPSEQSFRDWTGDRFTEELFEGRKRYFHRMQLTPFAPVLFGNYADYFQELKTEEEKPVTDDDYAPYKSEGVKTGGQRSPKPADELAKMSDEEILSFLNEWENVHHDPDEWWVDINFEGISQAFQAVFNEVIIPDESRLRFWIENRNRIERPIYVRAIMSAIHDQVKLKQFDMLDRCFDLCEWVLSHPDRPKEEGVNRSDESREHSDWRSSRRAVGDFVEMCLKEDVNAPVTARERLASLLDKLCTQYDRRLDDGEPVLLNRDDLPTEAINNTRSRALESLVYFGDWVRRQSEDDQADTPEVFAILDKRLGSKCEHALKLPEYALLGLHYGRICGLDREWAARHKGDFFPQEKLEAWAGAFGSYLRFHRPHKPTFDIVRGDIEFAIEKIDEFKTGNDGTKDLADRLGEHLFSYYLWKVYPLKGDDSLLERFYEKTKDDRDRWSRLFFHVGRSLKNSGKQLEESLEKRVIEFFEWRLEQKEPSELKEFTFWLEAECLSAEWRLTSFSKILDICGSEGIKIYTQVDALRGMIEDHTALVVECFVKLTDLVVKSDGAIYIQTDKAKPILRAGLDSDDATVRENAEQARENLLRCGHFELLDEEN